MTRVLALTRYGPLGASSRVRTLQYVPHLRALGIHVQPVPLLSDAYVRDLYAGRRASVTAVAAGYARRLAAVLGGASWDTVWLEKEMLPWVPWGFERWLHRRGRRLVVDIDDAVWLRYAEHGRSLVRRLLGGKLARVMNAATVVAAGNPWIEAWAREAGARATVMLPTVVDLEHYPAAEPREPGPVFTIGWIGSPSTVRYLEGALPVLRTLAQRRTFRLVVIGARLPDPAGLDVEYRAWSADTEAAEIRRLDAGIMPLSDGPWERGKCGYKLIQYMACTVPAVASAVGANTGIIEHGVNGLLVRTPEDWISALEQLMDDPALRRRLAAAGRRAVEQHYSVQARLGEVAALLRP